jgi:hypothetical protein
MTDEGTGREQLLIVVAVCHFGQLFFGFLYSQLPNAFFLFLSFLFFLYLTACPHHHTLFTTLPCLPFLPSPVDVLLLASSALSLRCFLLKKKHKPASLVVPARPLSSFIAPLSTKPRTFFVFVYIFYLSFAPLVFLRETDIVNRSFNLFLQQKVCLHTPRVYELGEQETTAK